MRAIDFWYEGNLGAAYTALGYAMHLVEDMGQPAHSNEDLHPGDDLSDDDSLEDWMTEDYCRRNYAADEGHAVAERVSAADLPAAAPQGDRLAPGRTSPATGLPTARSSAALDEWEHWDEVFDTTQTSTSPTPG